MRRAIARRAALVLALAAATGVSSRALAAGLTGSLNGDGSLTLAGSTMTFTNSGPAGGGAFVVDATSGGFFSPLVGTFATLQPLTAAAEPAGTTVSVPNWLVFSAAPTVSFTVTKLLSGILSSASCGAAPAAGQACTPAGSPLNLFNQTATSSTLSFVLEGTLVDSSSGQTAAVNAVFTAQIPTNFQTLLTTLAGSGTVKTTYSAGFAAVGNGVVIAKAFGASSVPPNGTTSLTFTLQNASPTVAQTGVGFVDTLPAGMSVATPNGLSATTCIPPGTITATAGSGTVSLAGATLAANGSCSFSVNVTVGSTLGPVLNSVTVTSTSAGTGNTATASLSVASPSVVAVPALGPGGLALLAVALALAGAALVARRS